MSVHYIVFSCLVYLASPGWTAPEAQVAFKCATNASLMCIIPSMKFEDSSQALLLSDANHKTRLNIKAGSITALTMKHCDSLQSFEEITIGSTGLGELCVGKSFRRVTAKNNNIRVLHATDATGDGDFRLELLNLNDNNLDSVESMRTFVALKELHLERNVLTKLDMSVFAKMKHLEKLMLGHNRLVRIADGVVELPKLSFFGLANNTLTGLNVQQWNMEALETLELASNILSNVPGFSKLVSLNKITLAGNSWQCEALEEMLEALLENSVTIADADLDCDGLRKTSICCTVYNNTSEQTLLNEMEKYANLERRYDESKKQIEEQFASYKKSFDNAIDKLKQSKADKSHKMSQPGLSKTKQTECKKTADLPEITTMGIKDDDASGTDAVVDDNNKPKDPTPPAAELCEPPEEDCTKQEINDDASRTGAVVDDNNKPVDPKQPAAELCVSPEKDCICPKEEVDSMKAKLKELQTRVEESQKNATIAIAGQLHLQRTAVLKRHEFRSAVTLCEKKLQDVRTNLEVLRNYIDSKLN